MPKIKTFFKKATEWILKHAISILIVMTAFWACFLFIYQVQQNALHDIINSEAQVKPIPAEVKKPVYYSALSGVEVANAELVNAPVTAIMIENSPSARPQSGLKNSGVVYEAVAEGGITRFLVLYQNEKPQLVGPVRSLRPYYVEWLKPYNASVAHVGGSKRALDEVRNGQYRDIDQFFNAKSYWRASDRRAPHNVYTSFEKIDALNSAKGYTSSETKGFERLEKDDKTTATPASEISIKISSNLYNPSYVYNAESKTYTRSIGGSLHLDREEGQIAPKVVVAMLVNENTVNEDGARENIITTGEGRAVIFQNGTVQDVKWQRNSTGEQIKFVDAAGKTVPLERGQVWISAVPNGKGSVSWK